MCGLCGFAGLEASSQERDMFKEHFWMMAVRGYQSSGVASVRKSGTQGVEVKIRKETRSSANFLFQAGADKTSFLHSFDNDLVMGHTRWPTKGDVTVENAHPFEHGDLVGAHNGTIFGMSKDGKTDSEMLIKKMSEIGVKEALEELYMSDAYAVTVYDKKKNRLYLARNTQRPLFVGVDQKRSVIHWGSDKHLLRCIADRVADKDSTYGRPCILDIYKLDPHILYDIPLEKIKAGKIPWTSVEIKKKQWAQSRVEKWDKDIYAYPDDDLDVFAANQSTNETKVVNLKDKVDVCACCGKIIFAKEKKDLVPFRAGSKWVYLCKDCDPETYIVDDKKAVN